MLALFPATHTHYPSATRTHVLRKSRFRAGRLAMTVNHDGDLHGDAPFGPVKRKFGPERHVVSPSSQARGDARKILNAASAAMVFHGIKSAVRGAKKLFRRVAILGVSCNPGAYGKRGVFHFC